MEIQTKLSTNLKWMALFLPSVQHLINLSTLKEIRSYRVVPHKNIQTLGACARKTDGTYTITLLTHSHELRTVRGTIKVFKRSRARSLNELLRDLAHELAHMITIRFKTDHPPKHLELEGRLITCLGKQARKLGIVDTWEPFNQIPQLKVEKKDRE